MSRITVRRTQDLLGCEVFGDPVVLAGTGGLTHKFCSTTAVLAYGDKLKNGDRVLVVDGERAREITVDFMEVDDA